MNFFTFIPNLLTKDNAMAILSWNFEVPPSDITFCRGRISVCSTPTTLSLLDEVVVKKTLYFKCPNITGYLKISAYCEPPVSKESFVDPWAQSIMLKYGVQMTGWVADRGLGKHHTGILTSVIIPKKSCFTGPYNERRSEDFIKFIKA
jgi:hypothetical protein